MTEFDSLDVRPYQLLCLICRRGRRNRAQPYHHESRLNEIETAVAANPILPLTLRCNTDSILRYQNPGREYDTPEGAMYNDLRDLTVLQRLGAVPGTTLPAVDLFRQIPDAVPGTRNVCGYAEAEAPGWPGCRFADSGNYERGLAAGVAAIIPGAMPAEQPRVKQESARACRRAARLRIRPHHLLCLTCFHDGRSESELVPVQEENLCECIRAMQADPEIPVELIAGPCMVCPPCSAFHTASNQCIGVNTMGLRDEKKDLDTLRRLGLRYGDVLPARELLRRLYVRITTPTPVCGYGDGAARSRAWSLCGGTTDASAFRRARQAGLGVKGVAVPTAAG